MLSAYSIILIVACAIAGIVSIALALRSDDKVDSLLGTAMAVVVITGVGYGGVAMIEAYGDAAERRERQMAQIEGIEDRYDVEVTEAVFGKRGDWKIDDAWVTCFIPDEEAVPADVTLSCDPTSNTATEFVDFADLD